MALSRLLFASFRTAIAFRISARGRGTDPASPRVWVGLPCGIRVIVAICSVRNQTPFRVSYRWVGERVPVQVTESQIKLSPRESEVARLVCKGFATKEIAFSLAISENTVKDHLTAMYRALRVSSRVQLALWCLQNPQVLEGGWGELLWQPRTPVVIGPEAGLHLRVQPVVS